MARLAFNLNNGNEFVFDLDLDHMSLGRTSENDIVIANSYISGRHCVFRRDPLSGLWEILDLNSQNGVTVNGVRVVRTQLQHGDKIALGQVEARFHLPETAPLRPSRDGSTSRIPKGGPAGGDTSRVHHVAPANDDAPNRNISNSPQQVASAPLQSSATSPARPKVGQGIAPSRSPPLPQGRSAAPASVPSSEQAGTLADLAQVKKDLTATRQILARRTALLQQVQEDLDTTRDQHEQLRARLAGHTVGPEELNLRLEEQSALNRRLVEELALVSAERDQLRHSLPMIETARDNDAPKTAELRTQIASLEAKNARASSIIADLEAQLTEARSPHPPPVAQRDLDALATKLAIASTEHKALLRENSQIELETAALETRRSSLSDELERLAESCSIASDQLSSLKAQIGQAKDEWMGLEQTLAPARSAQLAAMAELEALRQAALQELDNKNVAAASLAKLQAEATALRTDITALGEQRSREKISLGELRSSLEMGRYELMRQDRLLAEVEERKEDLSELKRRISQAQEEWARLEQRNALASVALQEVQVETREARELALQVANLNEQLSALESEVSQRHKSRKLVGHIVMDSGELTAGLIRRIDLLDNLLLHASRRGDTAPELIDQIAALRSSLIDLLREAGVEEVSVPAGTPIDIELRRRIKIIERGESSGDDMPKVLETLRPGFISALATGGDLVLRKVEVKTG
jgi:molecular chaperone GrpE (heat shock protein)